MEFEIVLDYNVLAKYDAQISIEAELKMNKAESLNDIHYTVFFEVPAIESNILLNKYKILLEKHGLTTHSDHILFFLSNLNQQFEGYHIAEHDFKEATKQFEKVVKLLAVAESNQLSNLTVKISGSRNTDSVTFDSAALLKSIVPAIVTEATKRVSNFAFNPDLYDLLKDVTPSFSNYSKILNQIKVKRRSAYVQSLAFTATTILSYLNEETTFVTDEGKLILNEQGRFIYKLFELFGFINDKIQSSSKDYIGTLIKNYLQQESR